jgi:hypothetical protein
MRVLHQALEIIFVQLEIIFEMQRKMIKEKLTQKQKSFSIYKTFFFFKPLLLSNLMTFLFVIHFK